MTVSGSARSESGTDRSGAARGGVLAALVLAALLTACSGDDAEPAVAGPASSTSVRDDEPDGATDATAGTELDGTSLEEKVEALERAMKATSSEVVDDATVRFVMADGTADEPVSTECISADAFLPEGTTVTIEYPDGERTC